MFTLKKHVSYIIPKINMNIFSVHANPFLSASMLCDTHCNSQVKESAQMLANCFSLEILKEAPLTQKGTPRKHSYFNHPSSKWARESKCNMRWLIDHAIELENQRVSRGFNPHFSLAFILWCKRNINRSNVPNGARTKFSIAISDDKNCRKIPNFEKLCRVHQYRQYYILDKPFAKWKKTPVPEWYKL